MADRRADASMLAALASGVSLGLPAFDDRLAEYAVGAPPRGDGGGGGARESSPVEATVLARAQRHQPDPATDLGHEFDRQLDRALREARKLFDLYRKGSGQRVGVEKMADPGCELCAQVEDHWCPIYGVVELEEPARGKRDKPKVRVLKLCAWCYRFHLPSRADRLPVYEEVAIHAKGGHVRWSKTPPAGWPTKREKRGA